MNGIARHARLAGAIALALALGAPATGALAQDAGGGGNGAVDAAPASAPAGAPEPLWVPDPESSGATTDDSAAEDSAADPLAGADVAVSAPAVVAPLDDPVSDELRVAIAHWMARGMQDAGLPPELPIMAALVESGLRNLPYGDRDSVGFFQMRTGIWDRGPYAGYLARPELQLRWFADHAIAVRDARRAAGDATFGNDPATWGEWIASIERPAAMYRGRYQPRLAQARALLATAAPPIAPFEVGLAVGAPAIAQGDPGPSAQAVLDNGDITLSPLAREDLVAGRVDPRLTDALAAAARVAPIAISVFQSGHSYLTVNGSVSNHSFGRGADISTVDGKPVSRSNAAAKTLALALARLPELIRPTEIGTPWRIDDPAYFTDGHHLDHLHVGFDTTVGGVAAVSSASPATGSVQTVSAAPPRVRAVAPTEPRFKAGAGSAETERSDDPKFEVDG